MNVAAPAVRRPHIEAYNRFCAGLAASAYGVQWGGAHVWKVGGWRSGKVFAIARDEASTIPAVSFKVSEIGWEVLRDAAGCRPAPYLASRGLKWIQADMTGGLSAKEIRQYIEISHRLAAASLSKKRRLELGLE